MKHESECDHYWVETKIESSMLVLLVMTVSNMK
jgi:hypothetical protein